MLSVVCPAVHPSVNIYLAWRNISLLSGRILMNFRTNIHHVSGNCWKGFQGQRAKVKVISVQMCKCYDGRGAHFDDNNANLCLIMVKTNRSTLHMVNNIQQSATQGSNDTTHRLLRRTAAITRFSPEGIGCQKQTAPRFCQHTVLMWCDVKARGVARNLFWEGINNFDQSTLSQWQRFLLKIRAF